MKKRISFFLILTLLFGLMVAPGITAQAGNSQIAWRVLDSSGDKISPDLQAQLDSLQSDETITVIVQLRQQANLPQEKGLGRAERLSRVIEALTVTADKTQGPVKKILEEKKSKGKVKKYISFWIFNGFSVTATSDVILELAAHPDVLSISSDELDIIPTSESLALSNPEANVSLVNAPALWGMGYTGQGVVVASMDSGVSMSHTDLSSRWRGGANSWYDPYGQHPATPTDFSGHGTWTMGVMVGNDSGGSTIGVAPGAQWIAVKMFNDSGGSTATAIHLGFQWLLNPDGNINTADAPHVVNNSWTYSAPGCYLDFEPDLQSLRAAGILPIFAAGNGGPNANTSYSPANNPSAFAVGAIYNNGTIYGLSSRGPTTCGGSAGVFPELVAPGVDIRTTDLSGLYTNASGTSLSAPHVAGGLALLLSAYANISASQQQNALLSSAIDLGITGPDDIYGYGRLDLLAAYQWLATAPTATPTPLPTFTATPTPTMTPTSAPATLHIGDLDRSSVKSGTKWNGTVTIYVHDTNHQPVAGATVYGKWSNGATGNVSCVTNSSGFCAITKTGLKTSVASITFTVTNMTHPGFTYQASSNHDPDGDSNGTTIIVLKP
jgi:subtilisin family serine protease